MILKKLVFVLNDVFLSSYLQSSGVRLYVLGLAHVLAILIVWKLLGMWIEGTWKDDLPDSERKYFSEAEIGHENPKIPLKERCWRPYLRSRSLKTQGRKIILQILIRPLPRTPFSMKVSRTNVCRVKPPWNWALAAAKRPMKDGVKFAVNISGRFRASFPEQEQQNFTRKFTAFSMATSTHGFREKLQGSTSFCKPCRDERCLAASTREKTKTDEAWSTTPGLTACTSYKDRPGPAVFLENQRCKVP